MVSKASLGLEGLNTKKKPPRSSERTNIAYFPVTLILKDIRMVWTGRRTKVLKADNLC